MSELNEAISAQLESDLKNAHNHLSLVSIAEAIKAVFPEEELAIVIRLLK